MADEQIIVDIQVDSKEVITAEKNIDDLTDSIEELGNRIKDARKQNKEYKKDQEELNKSYKDGKISTEQYEKGIDGLNTKIKTNNKVIAETQVELGKERRERTANIKLVKSEVNSRDQLRQKISILNKEYSELNTGTKQGADRSEELKKELKKLNEELNEGSLAAGNFKDNIGNYPEAAKGASGGVNLLGDSFKALLANPVVLVMALIVGALNALFSAFKKSESGAKLLDKAGAALKGLFMVLTSVMNTLAKALTSAFENPKQAALDLVDTVKNTVINSFKGWIELFKSLVNIDFSNLKESLKDVGSAMVQIGTGLTKEQQKDIADGMEETAKQAALLAEKMVALAVAQRAIRAQSRELEKEIAVLSGEFERLSEIAGDDTRNLHEMRNAAIAAGDAAVKLAEKQVKLAQVRLNLINQEVAVRRSAGEDIQGLLDQQAQAEVALTDARSLAAIAQQKILIEQRKIERDIFEQNLDILLDVGDKIKTEQEKAIQNESISLEKRKQLLEGSKVALAANFAEIKKEYELYGVTAEQINEVINASDAKQTNEKLKALGLNEIANNRLREIILERKQAELDFNDLSKDLSDEEIERKKDANETIKEINDKRSVDEIEDAAEKNDKLIELEKEKLEKLLENDLLLIEERAALQAESDERIRELEEEKIEFQKEKDEENLSRISENLAEIASITEDFAGAEIAIFGRIAEGIATAFEDGVITAESALAGLSVISNAVFAAMSQSVSDSLSDNEKARERELEMAGDNEAAKAAIDEKYDKISAALRLKQFKIDKAAALIQAGIQTALGVTQALAGSPPPASFILAGVVGALGATQIGIIAASPPPEFGQGTSDIVGIGDSHSSGNDTDVWGFSGGQKQYFGKVEKGEAMPVIRKSAANDYMVSQLNGKYSSKGNTFADGTNDITNQGQINQGVSSDIITAIQEITIVAKIEDITKEAGKKIEIVDNSKF